MKPLSRRGNTVGVLWSPSIQGVCKTLYTGGFVRPIYRRGFAVEDSQNPYWLHANIHTHIHILVFSHKYWGCFTMEASSRPSVEVAILWGFAKPLYRRGFVYTYLHTYVHFGVFSYRYEGCFAMGLCESLYTRGFVKSLEASQTPVERELCTHIHKHISVCFLTDTGMLYWRGFLKPLYRKGFVMETWGFTILVGQQYAIWGISSSLIVIAAVSLHLEAMFIFSTFMPITMYLYQRLND